VQGARRTGEAASTARIHRRWAPGSAAACRTLTNQQRCASPGRAHAWPAQALGRARGHAWQGRGRCHVSRAAPPATAVVDRDDGALPARSETSADNDTATLSSSGDGGGVVVGAGLYTTLVPLALRLKWFTGVVNRQCWRSHHAPHLHRRLVVRPCSLAVGSWRVGRKRNAYSALLHCPAQWRHRPCGRTRSTGAPVPVTYRTVARVGQFQQPALQPSGARNHGGDAGHDVAHEVSLPLSLSPRHRC
jgi:hypothetical protein